MPESPSPAGTSVVKLSVYCDGKAIADTIGVISVEVTKRVNTLPWARIVLLDGDMPNKDFPLSSSDTFKPGTEISVAAGYGQNEETIYEGLIIRHGVSITGNNASRLTVECRDKAVAMTIGRRNANFVDLKDSEIIEKLVRNHSGLSSDVAATTTTFAELVQYYCTDWDYLLARAEVNGLLVIVDAGKVVVRPPDVGRAPDLKVTYGLDLMEFHADMDVRSQLAAVRGVAWDPKRQQVVEEEAGPMPLNQQGDLDGATLAGVVGPDSYRIQTATPLESSALKSWTAAQQVRAALARIRGSMRFHGSSKAAAGTLIELEGVGSRFDGNVFATAVHHLIQEGHWTTEVEFGMDPYWFVERPDVVAPPASGWTPGIEGLQIGVVQKLDENPQGEPMVQVVLPVLQADSPGVWARLSKFHASDGAGAFFIPEVGDEVVLGFLTNDPSAPVILGSLYSSKHKPPFTLTAENATKAIVTKSGLKLTFDDEEKAIALSTPAGNRMNLSDDEKSITLEDQNGNKLQMGTSGIRLDSPKDIQISAKGKVSIKASGAVAIDSTLSDVTVSGMNVKNQGKVGFVGKGNATAELSAQGQTTVKGATVLIN